MNQTEVPILKLKQFSRWLYYVAQMYLNFVLLRLYNDEINIRVP